MHALALAGSFHLIDQFIWNDDCATTIHNDNVVRDPVNDEVNAAVRASAALPC